MTAVVSGVDRKAHNGGMQPRSTSSLGMEQVGGVTFACVGMGSGPTYRIWSGEPPLVMLATTQQASFCTLKLSSCRIWITRGTRWASRTLCSGEKEENNSKALSFSHTHTHCTANLSSTVEPLYKGLCMQSQTHRAVYKSTSELGTPLYTGQPAGSQWCPL